MGSIDTSGIVIDKYQYFPSHENSEKISRNFEEILEKKQKDFEIISGTF